MCNKAEPGHDCVGKNRANYPRWIWNFTVDSACLAFDIETTGLSDQDSITCITACSEQPHISYRWCAADNHRPTEFFNLMDNFPLICAFNAVSFDLKFLARCFQIPPERIGSWVQKLIDPYTTCKLLFGITFSLNSLLNINEIECKTSSGKEAVTMAAEGRWDDLLEYCMQDTMKTMQVVSLKRILIP